jgi:hypothetical protein
MCRMSWNLGVSTSWNPQGLSRTVMGLLYHLSVTWFCFILSVPAPEILSDTYFFVLTTSLPSWWYSRACNKLIYFPYLASSYVCNFLLSFILKTTCILSHRISRGQVQFNTKQIGSWAGQRTDSMMSRYMCCMTYKIFSVTQVKLETFVTNFMDWRSCWCS